METPKPLGYWLHHLHNLIETHFALVLSDLGTERREWQVLNTLAAGARTRAELERALAPFWAAGQPSLAHVLANLAARGWTGSADDTVALSPAGATAHAELARRVEGARAALLGDLTPDEYRQTLRTLATMAGNVESAIAAHAAASGTAAHAAETMAR
ncbi:MarR family winged helix-turn-helix transcriptional regulator [Plantactinospora sp. KBS50]|uniref:MarR family winged helix-turn-helix transcriptional regulator n=1 Tax=Plantactinospora sp. KBS50 TaxID=2024580 RepID=UPI000BAAD764|nr:MarR family winged helix-turn-helix transcriptional regulator [Plantactinospora sp. KBS50]ASW55554.1 hypothetical protein CIK06_17290 [Plantactinospora sp. KBS50]